MTDIALVFELIKTVITVINTVMDTNSLRGNLSTITDRCGRNVPFQNSVVFLTIHDTLLTTRGRRCFIVLFFRVFFFFAMVSNVVDTM